MEFRQLHYFIEVAQNLNYTTASKKLFVSQPALSSSIKNLEKELGTKLFCYDGKKLCLTDSGEILLKYAENLLEEQQKIIDLIQNDNNVIRGHIKIGVPELFSSCFYMREIMDFMQLYPEIKVTMVNRGSLVVQELIESGELDIGIISNLYIPEDLEVIELPNYYSLVLVVNSTHHLANKKSVSFSHLKNESFVNLTQTDYTIGKLTIQKCLEANFTPNIAFESPVWDTLIEAVANSLNVAILPAPLTEKYKRDDISFVPINYLEGKIPIGLVTKRYSSKSLASQRFIQYILDKIMNAPKYQIHK
jgi:DNA-binding transcriptional LysR family regulator